MFLKSALILLLGAASAAKPKCVSVTNDLPPYGFANKVSMELPGDLIISGNDMGIAGHMTTLKRCSVHDEASGTFGWNFERGTTTKDCGKPPNPKTTCPYQVGGPDPKCYYQFGFHKVQYGINAWGIPSSTRKLKLPINISGLSALNMDVEVNYTWTDLNPVSAPPVYRSRLIYDFFITTDKPEAHNNYTATHITDEITIDIGSNDHFQLPCGYKPWQSDKPLVPNIIPGFDLMDISDMDKACGSCQNNRMTHFRRQGSACAGNGKPCNVSPNLDLMKLINKARDYQPETRRGYKAMGSWLGSMEMGTEIYDNTKAEVMFSKFVVEPNYREIVV